MGLVDSGAFCHSVLGWGQESGSSQSGIGINGSNSNPAPAPAPAPAPVPGSGSVKKTAPEGPSSDQAIEAGTATSHELDTVTLGRYAAADPSSIRRLAHEIYAGLYAWVVQRLNRELEVRLARQWGRECRWPPREEQEDEEDEEDEEVGGEESESVGDAGGRFIGSESSARWMHLVDLPGLSETGRIRRWEEGHGTAVHPHQQSAKFGTMLKNYISERTFTAVRSMLFESEQQHYDSEGVTPAPGQDGVPPTNV